MLLPSGIIFVNADISTAQQQLLVNQLYITETISDQEFNQRVDDDPNYPSVVHGQNYRILVIFQNFSDYTNRTLADVAMFVKQGMASILKDNFGPPIFTFPIANLNIWQLLRAANSNQVIILPNSNQPPLLSECDCGPIYGGGGIVAEELRDLSGVHCVNPDNESNNINFINRK